jgi:3-hydroxybutyryl-CoA dehydratase
MELEPITRVVTQKTIDAYEEILGIGNPLHFNEEYASKTRFGGIIAHGMVSLAYISEIMGRTFGGGWYEGGELDTNFVLPIRPDDTITTRARVTGQKEVNGETHVLCEVYCENQKGQKVLSGTVTARLAKG